MDVPSLYEMKPVSKFKNNRLELVDDPIVIETKLNLVVNNAAFAALVCSPAAYQELAVGYLLSEGILARYSDLQDISFDNESRTVKITTTEPIHMTGNDAYRQINTCAGKGKQGLDLSKDENLISLKKWISATNFDAPEKIAEVTRIFTESGASDATKSRMQFYHDKALDCLSLNRIPEAEKAELTTFAGTVLSRVK